MKRSVIYLWLCAAVAAACSCNGQARGAGELGQQVAQDAVRELPLPEMPSTMTVPEERAEFLIGHFWDGMDFTDTVRSHDRLFMEQSFVNFLSLFPHARQGALSTHIERLLLRADADSVAFKLVNDLAERYLDDPNSPMRDEEYYILFLEGLLRVPGLPEEDRVRSADLLETAKKNRRGTAATDFAYTDRGGREQTLYGTLGKQLLLLFYDPACSHCSAILKGLHESSLLDRLVSDKELVVLAVYTEGDRKLWDETKHLMPREWTVAIDDSRIVERELYFLPAMPVIYLLDSDKTVLLKDPTPASLEAFFVRQSSSPQ